MSARFAVATLLALTLLAIACDKAPVPAPSFTIRSQIEGVTLDAIDAFEITITPRVGEHFMMIADGSYEGGQITTHVAVTGQLTIRVSRDYVRAHVQMNGANLLLDILVFPAMATTTGSEPTMDALVIQNRFGSDVTIARGSRPLPWPLHVGEISQPIRTQCLPGMTGACMNMPMMGGDAGL